MYRFVQRLHQCVLIQKDFFLCRVLGSATFGLREAGVGGGSVGGGGVGVASSFQRGKVAITTYCR